MQFVEVGIKKSRGNTNKTIQNAQKISKMGINLFVKELFNAKIAHLHYNVTEKRSAEKERSKERDILYCCIYPAIFF